MPGSSAPTPQCFEDIASSAPAAASPDDDDEMLLDERDSCLYISTTTWARDSHELFDYEARHVHQRSYFLRRSARILRMNLDVQVVPEGHDVLTVLTTEQQEQQQQSTDHLVSIRHREGRYIVVPADKTTSNTVAPKKLWLIVKELPMAMHRLQEGDVIKLGRFKLRVRQLVTDGPSAPELRLDDVDPPQSTVTPEDVSTMQCRICLLDGGTEEDPLVCPCQCKGSIKFVHLDCLRHWVNGRLALSSDQQKMSFFFKQLHCELCKSPFPSAIILNSERIPIVRVPKIEPPFLILENATSSRGLHVISMETKKELKLGRGHESDVRIADVSISRYHATIRFADGEFTLEDHNSKFGTLVSLRKLHSVDAAQTLAIQVGRTIMKLSLRRPPSGLTDVLPVFEDAAPTPDFPPQSTMSPTPSSFTCAAIPPPDYARPTGTVCPLPGTLGLLRQRDLYDRLATAIIAARESGVDLGQLFEDPAWQQQHQQQQQRRHDMFVRPPPSSDPGAGESGLPGAYGCPAPSPSPYDPDSLFLRHYDRRAYLRYLAGDSSSVPVEPPAANGAVSETDRAVRRATPPPDFVPPPEPSRSQAPLDVSTCFDGASSSSSSGRCENQVPWTTLYSGVGGESSAAETPKDDDRRPDSRCNPRQRSSWPHQAPDDEEDAGDPRQPFETSRAAPNDSASMLRPSLS